MCLPASWITIKACQRPVLYPQPLHRKAEETSSQGWSDGQSPYLRLISEQSLESDRPTLDESPSSQHPHPLLRIPKTKARTSRLATASSLPALSHESSSLITWTASWKKHIFPLQWADATQIWYIICKWFQSLFVYSKEITELSNCIVI